MAWDQKHKINTRQKILKSAAKLFLHRGYDAVSIDDVMSAAGLTRGAFYSHFASKNELYAEAIVTAGKQSSETLHNMAAGTDSLHEILQRYLSDEHRTGDTVSCPLAFLITDITQRDELVRETYTQTFRMFLHQITARATDQEREQTPEAALQTAVMMIGGLALARAVSDDSLSHEILHACRAAILEST